ncbi:MAG: hypothetical protein AB1772_11930 [Candidatus Zixiibacteriota bacterium]
MALTVPPAEKTWHRMLFPVDVDGVAATSVNPTASDPRSADNKLGRLDDFIKLLLLTGGS